VLGLTCSVSGKLAVKGDGHDVAMERSRGRFRGRPSWSLLHTLGCSGPCCQKSTSEVSWKWWSTCLFGRLTEVEFHSAIAAPYPVGHLLRSRTGGGCAKIRRCAVMSERGGSFPFMKIEYRGRRGGTEALATSWLSKSIS